MVRMLLKNERGLGLIHALLITAFTSAAFLALMPMMQGLSKSNEFVGNKLTQIDTKNAMLMALSNSRICGCQMVTTPGGSENTQPVTFNAELFPEAPLDASQMPTLSAIPTSRYSGTTSETAVVAYGGKTKTIEYSPDYPDLVYSYGPTPTDTPMDQASNSGHGSNSGYGSNSGTGSHSGSNSGPGGPSPSPSASPRPTGTPINYIVPVEPIAVEIPRVRMSCDPNSPELAAAGIMGPNGLKPSAIKVRNLLAPTVGNEWKATLTVEYESGLFQTKVQPTDIELRMLVDTSNPNQARITCCAAVTDTPSILSCTPPEVPASTPVGMDIRVEYWKLVGQIDPVANTTAGCVAPKTYMERWQRGEFYISTTNVDLTCRVQADGKYMCIRRVTPERRLETGCY